MTLSGSHECESPSCDETLEKALKVEKEEKEEKDEKEENAEKVEKEKKEEAHRQPKNARQPWCFIATHTHIFKSVYVHGNI